MTDNTTGSLAVRVRDAIRGCLMGGAAGDALGYPVEFMSRGAILSHYGVHGVTCLETGRGGRALVSDDTQMTLFTAAGMLMGLTRGHMRGIGGRPETYVSYAYMDWYYTQTGGPRSAEADVRPAHTWLRDLPRLASCRAPGTTCLRACQALLAGRPVDNHSKGCGGLMRVAPMALLCAGYEARGVTPYTTAELDTAGAEVARVTHLHPLGFLPAALLTHLLHALVPLPPCEACRRLPALAEEAVAALDDVYPGEYEADKRCLASLTRRALSLAESGGRDADCIRMLGEGWVAEEAWAIALFCALRHAADPGRALCAAVNHDGDSDSTGSICGNIVGAIHGFDALRHHLCPPGADLTQTLELADVVLALADDLATGCIISEYDPIDTPEKQQWYDRYCRMCPAGLPEADADTAR